MTVPMVPWPHPQVFPRLSLAERAMAISDVSISTQAATSECTTSRHFPIVSFVLVNRSAALYASERESWRLCLPVSFSLGCLISSFMKHVSNTHGALGLSFLRGDGVGDLPICIAGNERMTLVELASMKYAE